MLDPNFEEADGLGISLQLLLLSCLNLIGSKKNLINKIAELILNYEKMWKAIKTGRQFNSI